MTPQIAAVKGYIVLTLAFRKEGRVWLGRCLQLGTSTHARSLEQVKAELIELVELHLNELEQVGERGRFFAENGITFHPEETPPTEATLPIPIDGDDVYQPHVFPLAA